MFKKKDRDIFYQAMDKAQDTGDAIGSFIHKHSKSFLKGFFVLIAIILFGGILMLFSILKKSLGKKDE